MPANSVSVLTSGNSPLNLSWHDDSGLAAAGYISTDYSAIAYHAQLLSNAGINVLVLDMSNLIYYEFPSGSPSFASAESSFRANNYPPLSQLSYQFVFAALLNDLDQIQSNGGPAIYLVPALGTEQQDDVQVGTDGLSPYQRALKFVVDGFNAHPNRKVIYQGNPLVVVYQNPGPVGWANGNPPQHDPSYYCNVSESQALAISPQTTYATTIRHMSGWNETPTAFQNVYLAKSQTFRPPFTELSDGQDQVSTDGHSNYGPNTTPYNYNDAMWSWVDPYYDTANDTFGTYTFDPRTGTAFPIEFVHSALVQNALLASAQSVETFRSGETINDFMSMAKQLHPRFMLVNQFNEAGVSDVMGYSANTNLNIEPDLDPITGNPDTTRYMAVANSVWSYKAYEAGTGPARISAIRVRANAGTGVNQPLVDFGTIGNAPMRVVFTSMGPSLGSFGVPNDASYSTLSLSCISPSTGLSTSDTNPQATPTATLNGTAAVSMLLDRVFPNSPIEVVNIDGAPITAKEGAITADISAGTYQLVVNDTTFNGSSPGGALWASINPTDTVSSSRVNNASLRNWVSTGNNVAILTFDLDGPASGSTTVTIQTWGPSLSGAPFNLGPGVVGPLVQTQLVNGAGTVLWTWIGEGTWPVSIPRGKAYSIILSNSSTNRATDGIGVVSVSN